MLNLDRENLERVNRIVARREPEHIVELKGQLVRYSVMHVSLYVDDEQVALGAPKQKKARNGEFTTDRSGLRMAIKILEALSGKTFKCNSLGRTVEVHYRSDHKESPTVDLNVAQVH